MPYEGPLRTGPLSTNPRTVQFGAKIVSPLPLTWTRLLPPSMVTVLTISRSGEVTVMELTENLISSPALILSIAFRSVHVLPVIQLAFVSSPVEVTVNVLNG